MRSAGGPLLGVCIVVLCFLAATEGRAAAGEGGTREGHPRVITDGRLRPGHLEMIRVAGFPGTGHVEVSFFPTAICEDSCGARTFRRGPIDAGGAGRFRVRVPGTFLDHRNRPTYFRDGERIDVEVTWEGADDSFAFASAEPVLVRTHGTHDG